VTRRADGLPSWPSIILLMVLGLIGTAMPFWGGIIGWLTDGDQEV
jgi:hypothetical protein